MKPAKPPRVRLSRSQEPTPAKMGFESLHLTDIADRLRRASVNMKTGNLGTAYSDLQQASIELTAIMYEVAREIGVHQERFSRYQSDQMEGTDD